MSKAELCGIGNTCTQSVDDKCIVPVGEPGTPISTSVRSHNRSLSLTTSGLAALDHDFHIQGIVPSVLCEPSQVRKRFLLFSGQTFCHPERQGDTA